MDFVVIAEYQNGRFVLKDGLFRRFVKMLCILSNIV